MSNLYDLYSAVGKEKYGEAIAKIAPYFGTIYPEFVDLKPAYCEIIIRNRKELHNHLGSVHAIAMCNGAELVAGLMTDVSIPVGSRWIPVAMSVRYLEKVKTDVRVVADGKNIHWDSLGDLEVPVDIFDANNKKVFTSVITMNIKR